MSILKLPFIAFVTLIVTAILRLSHSKMSQGTNFKSVRAIETYDCSIQRIPNLPHRKTLLLAAEVYSHKDIWIWLRNKNNSTKKYHSSNLSAQINTSALWRPRFHPLSVYSPKTPVHTSRHNSQPEKATPLSEQNTSWKVHVVAAILVVSSWLNQ